MQHITQTHYKFRDRGTNFKSQAARKLLAQHTFKTPMAMHIYDDNRKRQSMDNLLHGPTKIFGTKRLAMNRKDCHMGTITVYPQQKQ